MYMHHIVAFEKKNLSTMATFILQFPVKKKPKKNNAGMIIPPVNEVITVEVHKYD